MRADWRTCFRAAGTKLVGDTGVTVQQTLDDVFDSTVTPVWFDHPDTNMVAQAVNKQGNYGYVPRACRLVLNSGTGSARLTAVQAGILG